MGAISELRLQRRVMMYPGADEAGCEVLARAISEMDQKVTKVFPFYASYLGPQIVPLYEDRIMIESLKSHLMVANCVLVDHKEDAAFIETAKAVERKILELKARIEQGGLVNL